MPLPVEPVHSKECVLEEMRFSVQTILMKFTCVVVYYYSGWGLKARTEDLERVSWWFTGFHHLKAITYTMMAEDGEYTRAERGVAIGLFTT